MSSASTSIGSSASCAWPSATTRSSSDAERSHAAVSTNDHLMAEWEPCLESHCPAVHDNRGACSAMAIQVDTRDCAALGDADLDEMASMGGAFDIGSVSKAKEDWVLSTTARIDGTL